MKAFAFSLCAISPVVIVLCAFYVAYFTVFFFFLFFFLEYDCYTLLCLVLCFQCCDNLYPQSCWAYVFCMTLLFKSEVNILSCCFADGDFKCCTFTFGVVSECSCLYGCDDRQLQWGFFILTSLTWISCGKFWFLFSIPAWECFA